MTRHSIAVASVVVLMAVSGGSDAIAGEGMPVVSGSDDDDAGCQISDLGLVVNDADPFSVSLAGYYQKRRCLPDANIVHVRFDLAGPVMDRATFAQIRAQVDSALGAPVQFLALAWATPNRVECMSMSTAFADRFDEAYCASGCAMTRRSRYFDSDSRAPFTDHRLRPTFHIGAATMADSRNLIDRGVQSDGTRPTGTAYLVSTPDRRRNVRAAGYPAAVRRHAGQLHSEIVEARGIRGREDVLFYFTGTRRVSDLAANRFVPGAVGDNLTSAGGVLTSERQTTVLQWLAAGVTATYGTVIEPCNFREKFPDPAILLDRYLAGESLIEAYWKSVEAPGQGMFVGEPMARPWGAGRCCDGVSAAAGN